MAFAKRSKNRQTSDGRDEDINIDEMSDIGVNDLILLPEVSMDAVLENLQLR